MNPGLTSGKQEPKLPLRFWSNWPSFSGWSLKKRINNHFMAILQINLCCLHHVSTTFSMTETSGVTEPFLQAGCPSYHLCQSTKGTKLSNLKISMGCNTM